jgi:hypothetical protein
MECVDADGRTTGGFGDPLQPSVFCRLSVRNDSFAKDRPSVKMRKSEKYSVSIVPEHGHRGQGIDRLFHNRYPFLESYRTAIANIIVSILERSKTKGHFLFWKKINYCCQIQASTHDDG